jgi:hypothetical protein
MRSSTNLMVYVLLGSAAFAQDDALRGKTAMSVYVNIEGDKEISAAELRLSIEEQLHHIGITVLPHGDPPNYPVLLLTIDVKSEQHGETRPATVPGRFPRTETQSVTITSHPYTLTVELKQLAPGQTPQMRPIRDVTIWKKTTSATTSALMAWVIGDEALELTIDFVDAWLKVNGRHPPTPDKLSRAPAAGTAPAPAASGPGQALHGSEANVISRGVIGSLYDVPDSQRDMVEQQVKDLIAKGQKVINCEYGPSNPQTQMGYATFNFWYQTAPANILKLLTSTYRHPLMEEGRVAVSACPATRALAENLYRNRFN